MDPRTGQILHAQVFMTSVFESGGRAGLLKRLRYLDDLNNQKTITIGLKGFDNSVLCNRSLSQKTLQSLIELVSSDVSDEVVDKATLDYVREVVAHEIGHTMGLRHNFAGSLSASFSALQKPEIFKILLKNMKTPEGVNSSSSVMEYEPFEDALFTGDMISRKETVARSYDTKAMEVLYKQKKIDNSIPLFCTDSDLEKYFDCNQFDSGFSPMESNLKNDL